MFLYGDKFCDILQGCIQDNCLGVGPKVVIPFLEKFNFSLFYDGVAFSGEWLLVVAVSVFNKCCCCSVSKKHHCTYCPFVVVECCDV